MKKTLLADFHVHTNYSDGLHSLSEVVDLYGLQGFGAIAITDHICETTSFLGRAAHHLERTLTTETYPDYIQKIQSEAERALKLYNMIVMPGFEVSKNSWSNHKSAHVLGIGCEKYVSADLEINQITQAIRSQGGLTVAAHPVWTRRLEKQTLHLWGNKENLINEFDAWEVASGPHFFDEVKQSGLPMLASGDLHSKKQITSWKTTLRCEPHTEAILDSIRKQNIDFYYYKESFSHDYKRYLERSSLNLEHASLNMVEAHH